jgi:hypothetical protein
MVASTITKKIIFQSRNFLEPFLCYQKCEGIFFSRSKDIFFGWSFPKGFFSCSNRWRENWTPRPDLDLRTSNRKKMVPMQIHSLQGTLNWNKMQFHSLQGTSNWNKIQFHSFQETSNWKKIQFHSIQETLTHPNYKCSNSGCFKLGLSQGFFKNTSLLVKPLLLFWLLLKIW